MKEYLEQHIATAAMVAADTGVEEKNLCRYKRMLEKAGQLWVLYRDECKRTKRKANYLTTNPELAPGIQRKLDL